MFDGLLVFYKFYWFEFIFFSNISWSLSFSLNMYYILDFLFCFESYRFLLFNQFKLHSRKTSPTLHQHVLSIISLVVPQIESSISSAGRRFASKSNEKLGSNTTWTEIIRSPITNNLSNGDPLFLKTLFSSFDDWHGDVVTSWHADQSGDRS